MQNFVVTLFLIALLQWNHKSKGYYELVEELGCQDTEFRLTCGRVSAKIAIIEATFSHNDSVFSPVRASCGDDRESLNEENWRIYRKNDTDNVYAQILKSGVFEVNFRHAIKKKCSGVNYCSFILKEDYAPAIRWGSGSVYLRYMCMDDVHIIKTCTADLDVNFEGFIQSPGYPRFYIGERTCRWTLRARPSQTVKVKFLDISLRGVAPFKRTCEDWLVVSEDGFNRLTACGDTIGDTEVQSSGSVLNISLIANTKLLFPKRGLLFHYKAVGCLTPKTPQNANLVFRNESQIHFRCCPGFVFPDTSSKDRVLHCYNDNTWDKDVPDCVGR
ncbi:UNVERIFIED_CONTAM: hypothetical protein PYX00_006131 [Menopon gallinae]|uniref:Uncharacterized protein n=1 Tax=Menopon gallinae TaxID=328185 RepID=A0AAW2HVA3_9NEOP